METTPAVSLSNVSFSYGENVVLTDVNMTVDHKDFLSIVGPNAGGKSTLLKLILGLLKPDTGTVMVYGRPPVHARSRIGYMPQKANLDGMFPVNVLDVVLMGRLGTRTIWGPFRRNDHDAAHQALKLVEMESFAKRAFSDLSGGQQQRVLIARALVSDPELLILDEPTSNVDVAVENELFDLLGQLNKRMTILLVTHDLGFVSSRVEKVACVNRRVLSHPTCDISKEIINEIYGTDVRMVRHDHGESTHA